MKRRNDTTSVTDEKRIKLKDPELPFKLSKKELGTKLIESATEGDTTTCKELIKAGADPETKDDFDCTALHNAVLGSHTETCKALIDNGANVNLESKDAGTPLYIAAEIGDLETCKILIENGADINQPDEFGITALMIAAEKGHTETVKFLIKSDADIYNKNKSGTSFLLFVNEHASEPNIKEIYEFYIEHSKQKFNEQVLIDIENIKNAQEEAKKHKISKSFINKATLTTMFEFYTTGYKAPYFDETHDMAAKKVTTLLEQVKPPSVAA